MAKTAIKEPEANPLRKLEQNKLKSLPALLAEYREAGARLGAAEEEVRNGDRPQNYTNRFATEVERLQRIIWDLQNKVPGRLIDSCQDVGLRDDWQIAKTRRSRAAGELSAAQQDHQDVRERINRLKNRISEKRGPAEVLSVSQTPESWGFHGDEIRFNKHSNHPQNIVEYETEWRRLQRELKLSEDALNDASERHRLACERVDEIRQAMIDSPI